MTGGLDLLIVGIADENLDYIDSEERLRELFDDDTEDDDISAEKYFDDFYSLVKNSDLENPRIFYLGREHMEGAMGTGLGYVIFDGNLNDMPKRLDEKLFGRIDELKQKFIDETSKAGLNIPSDKVGVYALNVYDT